jgi:NAD(P)-dependent dehydrogenase (short-subunit alcohol dehydrogenase family)
MGVAMTYLEDRLGVAGKTALIVGGGGGLGRASAIELGRAGMRLALCDRNAAMLEETVTELRGSGAAVISQCLDAREPQALADFFALTADASKGRLDVLVNVVGGTFKQDFAASKPSGWDALIRANFTWLLHAIHLAVPLMRTAGGGSIMSFTSIEGHRAAPGFAVYAGMKAAVTNLSRTLALELAKDKIRVNTIAPDLTPTEAMAALSPEISPLAQPESTAARMMAEVGIPAARFGTYEEIGGCVLFLASELSRYVTGTALHPDGGTWASAGWFRTQHGFINLPPPDIAAELLGQPKPSK